MDRRPLRDGDALLYVALRATFSGVRYPKQGAGRSQLRAKQRCNSTAQIAKMGSVERMDQPLPPLPVRGTITEPGHIRLESGQSVRFFDTACLRFRPEVGMEVWVIEVVPHAVGECRWRAKVVNLDGAIEPDAETQALARHRARNPLENPVLARELAKQDAEMRSALEALESPWDLAAEDPSVDLRALRERLGEHGLAACVSYLRAIDDTERALPTDAAFIDTWEEFPEPWCDPCFCPFATGDGDSLGVLLYPPTLEAHLPAPVVFRSRNGSPEFSWVAESLVHLERMASIAEKTRDQAAVDAERGTRHPSVERAYGFDDPKLGGEPTEHERSLVRDLLMAGDDEARVLLEELSDVYRERGWTFAQSALSAQRIKNERWRRIEEVSDDAATAAVTRGRDPAVLPKDRIDRLFAHATTFDLAGSPPLQKTTSPTPPRYGRSIRFPLTPERLTPSGAMLLVAFGGVGLVLLWLASRLAGLSSVVCALLGSCVLSPAALTLLAKLMTPKEIRFELDKRSIVFPTGFAWRRRSALKLGDVVEVGYRARSGGGALWFRTDQKEFSLPNSMFPTHFPARVVALRTWIRSTFARGPHPVDADVLATIEGACEDALRSSTSTQFTFTTLEDETRIIAFMKPGEAPVFPATTDEQRIELTHPSRETRGGSSAHR